MQFKQMSSLYLETLGTRLIFAMPRGHTILLRVWLAGRGGEVLIPHTRSFFTRIPHPAQFFIAIPNPVFLSQKNKFKSQISTKTNK